MRKNTIVRLILTLVLSISIANAGQYGSSVYAINDIERPLVPASLSATEITVSSITLTWNSSTDNIGVAGYKLYEYVKVNPYYSYWVLRINNITDVKVTVSGLQSGTNHKYAVSAYDAIGNESLKSIIVDSTTYKAPTAYHPNSGSVYAIVGQTFTYNVDAVGNPTPTFSIVTGPNGMTIDTNTGIVSWTPLAGDEGTANATVRATNSIGNSDHSFSFPVYSTGSDLVTPSQVRSITASNITSSGCDLSWTTATDNVGIAGYYIYAQKTGRGNSIFIVAKSSGQGTNYTVNSLQANTGYSLWVAGYDAAGNIGSISGATPARIITANN